MVNHARTLLLNSVSGISSELGEEFVPLDFVPVALNAGLTAARRVLFGANPDRLMLNYRLKQFMTLLHSTELEEFVTGLDSRVTYWPDSRVTSSTAPGTAFFDDYGPKIFEEGAPSGAQMFLQAAGSGVDATSFEADDRLLYRWRLMIGPGPGLGFTMVRVSQETEPILINDQASVQAFSDTNNISSPILLFNSGLAVTFTTLMAASTNWTVTVYARPKLSLPALVEKAENTLTTQNLIDIFGSNPAEPMRTFRSCWNTHDELAYKLGGLLLGMVYRTDELRLV